MSSENHKARVVTLISGGGRTFRNLVERSISESLSFQVVHMISTRFMVRGIDVANELAIPYTVIPRKRFQTSEDFSKAVVEVLDTAAADLIACGGFLSKLDVPDRFLGKIVNIHPSLLPLFGGKGFYGDRVHQAVLDSGMKVSGCTAHFVNNDYDAGPIIAQRCVPVHADDSVPRLAERVFAEECALYPSVVNDIALGRVWLEGDRTRFRQQTGDGAAKP